MRFTTLTDWLSWQEQLHPQTIDLGLDRVNTVWQRMGVALGRTRVITVAGTNGKGSTVAMLESIYLIAGYSVGTYTSPHVLHYNERIRVNGQDCDDATLCATFDWVDRARGAISLSYFEFGTLAALAILAQAGLDLVVLEVGLGGRLDAVNIIDADVALLASIAIDHQQWLGDNRADIGFEKAGIFRPGRYAICGDRQPPKSVVEHARRIDARLLCLGQDFDYRSSFNKDSPGWLWWGREVGDQLLQWDGLPAPGIAGEIQYDNAAGVIQAVQLLQAELPLSQQAIADGLRSASLIGRYQWLYFLPSGQRVAQSVDGAVEVIVDVAHNPAAATLLAQNLTQSLPGNTGNGATIAILGMMADKDLHGFVTPLLSVVDHWYVTALDVVRSSSVTSLRQALEQAARQQTFDVVECENISAARQQALQRASQLPGSRILVTGSFYTVAGLLDSSQD